MGLDALSASEDNTLRLWGLATGKIYGGIFGDSPRHNRHFSR